MKKILTVVFLCLLALPALWGQEQQELEKKKKQLEAEIKQTQQALQQTQKSKSSSLREVINLEKQIKLRQDLILNTAKQIKGYNRQIADANSTLKELEENLKDLRENYAKAIYGTYKTYRLADQLLFVASSRTFTDAFRRINYLRKVGEYRKTQVSEIESTQIKINEKLVIINEKKLKQEALLTEQREQEAELKTTKLQKDKIVTELQKKEGVLSKELAQKRREADKLNAQIQAAIAREIARQKKLEEERRRKEEAAKGKGETPPKKTDKPGSPLSPMTPEAAQLSASFAANKGKLPWPVERGVISRGYGKYKHPEYGGEMDNKGLNIRTDKNANVRAVFGGEVISIVSNPIYKNAIIISHGNYFTVYTQLESVSVAKGQKVTAKQIIGKAYTDEKTNETEVHFEIWQGNATQNPSIWIAR